MKYLSIPVTHYQQNCSLVWCPDTLKAAIIDPGGDVAKLLSVVDRAGVELEQIWLTHGHLDHVGGTAELAERNKLPIIGPHRDDEFWIKDLAMQAAMMGFSPPAGFTPGRWLEHGDVLTLGNLKFEVLHCPGHTPGHVVIYQPEAKKAFVGDVLFRGSIGRTDFPRGNHQQLLDSIRERLWPLGEEVSFVPGHGPESTFGEEMVSNPHLKPS